jgi:hypothetical protein
MAAPGEWGAEENWGGDVEEPKSARLPIYLLAVDWKASCCVPISHGSGGKEEAAGASGATSGRLPPCDLM